MKRIIAMLLAMIMLVSGVPVQAFATESQTGISACATPDCTYAAGHEGNCSNYVAPEEPDQTTAACETTGCEYEAGHEGHCSNYVEPAKDAVVYVTVSDRGELGMAYEEVTVSDINKDGKLSVDEALYAAHTVCGKGYASGNGRVTKLWDVETTNVSFFVNHKPISTDVSADTIRDGDYLVASVDQDAVNDYDKYSRFHVLEKRVDGGKEFLLTLVDNEGTALAGMEIGLWNGDGTTTMLGQLTDENGQAALTLDQEGIYCVTAKGTLVEQSYNLETEEFTSIETPIIAPVCVVTVSGNAETKTVIRSIRPAAKTAVVTDAGVSDDVNIYFSVVNAENGEFIISRRPMSVSPGTGAAYGWMNDATGETMWDTSYDHSVKENECTPLDALIRAHELMYGDDFNADTISSYLVGDADYITGFFQWPSQTGVSFRINGKAPTDGDGCSYASNEYVLKDNEELVFLTYTTFDFTSDVFAFFTNVNGDEVNELTVEAGQPVSLMLKGLLADPMNWGVENKVNLASVGILQAQPKENGFGLNLTTNVLDTTKADGAFTYTFNTAGEYYLSAKGPYKDENGMDHNLTMPLCKITVTAPACQHTDTETNYVPVAGQTKHTVTVTCTACKEKTQQDREEDCTDENGDNTCDSCKVALPVAVESIILKQGENLLNADSIIPLKMGETATLTATVSPENAAYDEIIWRSENTAVATVSGGVITPVAEGSTTIKVTAGGKEAACTVEVKPAVVAVESVSVVPETAQVEVSKTVDLTATVLPENATDKTVTWTSGDETIATVDANGKVTGVKGGSVTITATTTDGSKRDTCAITVIQPVTQITLSPATAEVEAGKTLELAATVLPVTATDKTVTWTSGDETIATVDQSGKVTGVADGTVTITATANNGVYGTCTVAVSEEESKEESSDVIVLTSDDTPIERKDVRVSKIQIKAKGTVSENDLSNDDTETGGRATVLIEGTPASVDVTLDLTYGGQAVKKGYVQVNDQAINAEKIITDTDLAAQYTTSVALNWIDDEAVITFNVGYYYASGGKLTNNKLYTLKLQKKGDASNNTDPAIADNAATTASVEQYSWYELDLGTIFDDAETEDSKLIYQVYTNGAWKTADQNYRYLVKTYGTTELKFKAKDAVGADSPEHTITLTISQYQAPEHGLLIGNVTDNGVLKSLTIQDASGNVLPVEFEVSGQNITVYLPGDQVSGNDTVKAVFDLVQVNKLPFLSKTNWANSARNESTNVFETELNSYSGTVTAYYWTEEPGTAKNENGYTITYQKLVGENQAPALADGVEATVTDSIAQYQTWSVDLSKIFTEPDEEAMSYTVSVKNGAAQDTDASYSYDCNESGTVTFVFTAADPSGLTATYQVTLTVTPVPRTVVSTELTKETANGVFCKGIQVTGYTLNSRVTHYPENKHKITFLLQYAENNASAELEFLSDFQDYVMYYYVNQSGKPTLESSDRITGPYTVTLANGEKILYLATTTAAKNERQDYQLIFRNQNHAPVPVEASGSGACNVQEPYVIDLKGKFTDADSDLLDYYVSVQVGENPMGEKQTIGAEWEYTAGTTDVHTLVFTASDGFVDSEPYTVTLNAELSEDVYTVNVKLPEAVTPAFNITDSVSGENGDVLGNVLNAMPSETADGWTTYQVIIPDNISRISVRGTTTENGESVSWGGMSILTKDTDGNAITDPVVLRQVKGVIDSQFNGAAPASADAKFVIQDKDQNYPVSGSAYEDSGYLTYRFLLVAQDGYTYSTVATGSLTDKYGTKVSDSTYSLTADSAENAVLKLYINLKNGVDVTVPQGSVVHIGKMVNYFKYFFFDEYYRMEENADGTVTYIFEVPARRNPDDSLGGQEFIRVQHPDGVTYWTYDDAVLQAGGELTLTADDLFIGKGFNKKSVIHDLSEVATDVADIYLSVNRQMYVNLGIGDTYKLNVFRNWQAVEGMTNARTALPDVHYTVIDANGDPSNVVTVTPDAFNSSAATVKANTQGTAIVLVTYDAMYSNSVCCDAGGYAGKAAKLSAIWPENTGVFVVSVGADGSSIVTNMDTDAEHDPIYYVGSAGAEFSFTPESGSTVTVARAIVGTNSLTYNGFIDHGVAVNAETGEVTVSGLTQGRHIIRVEKGGVAAYQVVTTKQTSYTITDADGNTVTENTPVQPGTELTIQFGDLYNPINKLAGIYNSNCAVQYTGQDGTVFTGSNGNTPNGYYVFAANKELHKLTIKIPDNWGQSTYTLDGTLKIGGFGGGGGGHRTLLYEQGREQGGNAPGVTGNPGVLPEITIQVAKEIPATDITVTPSVLEMMIGETEEIAATIVPFNSTDSVSWTSSDPTKATVSQNGTVTAKAAGAVTITATAGSKTAECKINVKEIEKVAVYFSVSHDAAFLKPEQTNKVVALQKLTVPYFDLALYGLEQYKVDKTHAAYGKPTMLHLYLYATEIFQLGVPEDQAGQGDLYKNNHLNTNLLTISGDPGALFMNKFWGMDENLNYYHNYKYPADETGYGMTADHVALKDGDIVTIGHFASWSFHSDPRSVFNYLVAGEDTVETTTVQNQEVTLKLYLAGGNLGQGGENVPVQEIQNVYYTKADVLSSGDVTSWTLLGTTDAKGELIVAMPDTGTYILAVSGQKGTTHTNDIVSTPGGIVLIVNESGANDPVKNAIALINTIDESLDVDDITAARDAYDALSTVLQKNVSNYSKLTQAEDALAVKQVEELIEGIGALTPDSREKIEDARKKYDALTDAQKEKIDNIEELLDAERYLSLLDISDEVIADMYWTTGNYLSKLTDISFNDEWKVIGLARAGRSVSSQYYAEVEAEIRQMLQTQEIQNNRLHGNKSTENARLILALTAIGKDVTDVCGVNLLAGLNDMEYIKYQGDNGPIWALIALDSHEYTPVGITRDELVAYILSAQHNDGGWALDSANLSANSDVDLTAMAIQALAPYYSRANVKAAVNNALDWLNTKQNEDGTFSFEGAPSVESTAQVIVALTALGKNPHKESAFIKNGISSIKAMKNFYVEGGGFKKGDSRNMMSTEQGYYALASYFRLLENKTSLYDMSDVTIETAVLNQQEANRVIALINNIGQVDITKEDEIEAAREAYEDLTDAQKALISASTLKILTDAETALAQLQQTAADTAAANGVKNLIDDIGTVTLNKESSIAAASSAYNALTPLQKNLVGATYLAKLAAAEAELEALKKAAADEAAASAVEQKIADIGTNITLGSESKINTARKAYDELSEDQKKLVSNSQTLVNAEAALKALKSTASVTFTLLGCYKHGTGETSVHTLAKGNLQTWISAKTIKIAPGDTVKDVFEEALTAAGLQWKNPTGNYVESIKYNGNWIGEFTNGSKSGWMYTLNGKHPNLGVNQQTLIDDDKIVFHYTDDYTKEESSNGFASSTTSSTTSGTTTTTSTIYSTYTGTVTNTAAAEAVDRLIEDIGEVITLDSEAKILAARASYDKLTEAQKKLVKNYDTLMEAEKKLAALKGTSSENIYLETGDYIQGLGTPGVGAIGGEWMVIGLARSGRAVPTGYYDHVLNYVRENINDEERLHSAKSSDNSRLILALTAIGKDVTNVDGHNLLQGLNNMDYIQYQGINGPIWALLAFDSGNYPVPEGDVSREKLIQTILDAQLSDGGWALSGERSDPDMTGMAIQALAPYMDSRTDVKKAVEEAVWTLSEIQNDNGSFTSVDGPNSESIAQVIVALAALGIDADTDARFVKNGISALDALLTYYIPGGGFRHVLDGNLDGMATEQAYYALVAYNRMKQNQNFLYDMTDVIDAGGDVIVEEITEPTEIPTEPIVEEEDDNGNAVVIWTSVMTVCAAAIAVLLLNRKKFFGKFL